MANNVNQNTSSDYGNLTRTIRSQEIIDHLTNFRVAVDKAMHVLPGVLLGVSCTGVIQASMNLTWHIEQLRGTLIEALIKGGHDPLTYTSRPDRPILVQSTTNAPLSTLRIQTRVTSQGISSSGLTMREYMDSVMDTQLAQPSTRVSRQTVATRTPTPLPTPRGISVRSDQVVPERPHRSIVMSPTPIRNDLLSSQRHYRDVIIPSISDRDVMTQPIFVESSDRHSVSRNSSYSNPPTRNPQQ
jgi:hypothetical protein